MTTVPPTPSRSLSVRAVSVRPRVGQGRASPSPLRLKIAAGIVLLATWEALVRVAAPAFVARPSSVLVAIPGVLASREFLAAAWSTIGSVLLGLGIALGSGTITGLAMGRLRAVDWSLRYSIDFLYAVPMVAILPLMTLWFGYSGGARLATVVFASFLTITVNVSDGARSVPPEYLEVARSFRARWHDVLFGVTLPAAVPYLFAGVRLAAGRALVAAVVAEFFTAIDGLGGYILFHSRIYQHARAFVAVLVLALVAVGVEYAMNWVTRRFLHDTKERNP